MAYIVHKKKHIWRRELARRMSRDTLCNITSMHFTREYDDLCYGQEFSFILD